MAEDCCILPPARRRRLPCPECATRAAPVEIAPVKFLVREVERVRDTAYWFCDKPGCETVYFDEGGERIRRSELRVRVGAKETQSPHLVCYCFGHTEEAIEADFRVHGKTTIPDRIRAEIAAGTCECEFRNPSGKCCLGGVMQAAKRAQRDHAGGT
jgi:hypothetical protein